MRPNWVIGTLIVVLSSFLASPISAQSSGPSVPRFPLGLYAKIDIKSEMTSHPTLLGTNFENYLKGLYTDMLSNPAVSGLAIQAHWDLLNPNPGDYEWSLLTDAFNQAATSNPPKSIQLIITPGFQSPQWLLDELPSCDALFGTALPLPAPSNCGRVTFTGFHEAHDSDQLPLPWDTTYKTAWQTFLMALSAAFGSNPLLVSISVAGPTAASDEMIMPNDNNCDNPQIFPSHVIETPKGPVVISPPPISPNNMWLALLSFHYRSDGLPEPQYQKSDLAFIEEWNNAIDMYPGIFSGLTLVANTGSGLPDFNTTAAITLPSVPSYIAGACGKVTMDCAAETTILSHFVDATVGGSNAKATQTSGVEYKRRNAKDLGLPGVKLISQNTMALSFPSAQILGGAQFNSSVANQPETEGSSSVVEEALYKVLQVLFSGAFAGPSCDCRALMLGYAGFRG